MVKRKSSTRLVSKRKTRQIESIWAVVFQGDDGVEGVVRRATIVGTIPWTTDDVMLAAKMLTLARRESGLACYLVQFDRVRP